MRTLGIIALCALSVRNATAQNTIPAAADTVPELEILRERHDKAQASIHEDAQAKLSRLNQEYLQSLDNLIGQLTRQGKLAPTLAVRAERNSSKRLRSLEKRLAKVRQGKLRSHMARDLLSAGIMKLLIAISAVFLALGIAAHAAPYPKCFPDWKAFETWWLRK